MKKVNATTAKNGTMKGFEGISDEKAAEIDEAVKKRLFVDYRPLCSL